MIVAIDGPAGVGKSTVTRCIAERANLLYVNSGDFYRSVTYFLLQNKIPVEQTRRIVKTAEDLHFEIRDNRLFVNGNDIETKLHTDRIDSLVAVVSSITSVRKAVNTALHRTANGIDSIVEGRDITTVVFPDADIKVFLDASVQTRAQRRWAQRKSSLSFEKIKESIEKRDAIDKNKKEGSLKISADALYLDTSDLTIDQVCEKVVEIIENCNKNAQEN